MDVDLVFLPGLSVETLEHTTKKKGFIHGAELRTMFLDVSQIYVRSPTLFIVRALLFASAMFIASVGLVNGTELGC